MKYLKFGRKQKSMKTYGLIYPEDTKLNLTLNEFFLYATIRALDSYFASKGTEYKATMTEMYQRVKDAMDYDAFVAAVKTLKLNNLIQQVETGETGYNGKASYRWKLYSVESVAEENERLKKELAELKAKMSA